MGNSKNNNLMGLPSPERVVRLGVTGLSRAGKTVFITSLVANLENYVKNSKNCNLSKLVAVRENRIKAADIESHPDDQTPLFEFGKHRDTLISPGNPAWPAGTTDLSGLRLSLRIQRESRKRFRQPEETIHLDIIDFPGEWLIDLTLMKKSFASWSSECLERVTFEALNGREKARAYLKQLRQTNTEKKLKPEKALALAKRFACYLKELKDEGYSTCTPGRFLQPGGLKGSPLLTFAPLYLRDGVEEKSFYKEFENRFEKYKNQVIQPFFNGHLSKIDRQVVLIDVLRAIEAGPLPFRDQRKAMRDILNVFYPEQIFWLPQWGGVKKVLFAATKADYLHTFQQAKLSGYPKEVLKESIDKTGAKTKVMSIAALKVTEECILKEDGVKYPGVRGRISDQKNGPEVFSYPGKLPDIDSLIEEAREGGKEWRNPLEFPRFLPNPLNKGQPLPHIRLDEALEFLIGDLLLP